MASQKQVQAYLTHWNQEAMQKPGVMENLSKKTGSLIHTFVWQLRKSGSRLRPREESIAGSTENKELAHMQRRLQQWERGIPIRFRPAVDALIAERMGIGLVEGHYWCWGGTEAGWLYGGYTMAPHRHTESDKIRQTISFRRMGHRPWYMVQHQLHKGQGVSQKIRT